MLFDASTDISLAFSATSSHDHFTTKIDHKSSKNIKNHQKTSKKTNKHQQTSTKTIWRFLVIWSFCFCCNGGHLVFGDVFLASLIKNSRSLHRRTSCRSHRRTASSSHRRTTSSTHRPTTSAQSRGMDTACKTLPLGFITPLASKLKYPV